MIPLQQNKASIDLVHFKLTQNKQSLTLNLALDISEYSKALTLRNVYLVNIACFYVISQKGLRDHCMCFTYHQPSPEDELFLNAQPAKLFILGD